MTADSRAPKRARARWLEGAPECVADCFDHPAYGDRYTVAFTESLADRDFGEVHYLAMSEAPTHPQGISVWGSFASNYDFARYRYANGKRRVRWLDLPEHIRAHVEARVKST